MPLQRTATLRRLLGMAVVHLAPVNQRAAVGLRFYVHRALAALRATIEQENPDD